MKIHIKDDTKAILEQAIKQNMAVLLVGDTGTGKTATIRELAKEQGHKLTRINLTGQTGVDDIIGKFLVNEKGTYWIDGLLTEAMKLGNWIIFDEINMALPDILSKLHSLLDDDRKIILNEKDGEIVKPHKDFRIFATMNPSDDYAGTKELNLAFLSRFGAVLQFEYADTEAEIITEQTDIEPETAQTLVSLAKEARENKKQGKLSYIISTRDLLYCATLIKQGLDVALSVETSIINKYPETERGAVSQLFNLMTEGKIKIKLADDSEVAFQSIDELKEYAKDTAEKMKSKNTEIEQALKETKEAQEKQSKQENTFLELVAGLSDTDPIEKKLKDNIIAKLIAR